MEANGVEVAVQTLIDTDVSVADHAELAVLARSVARLQSFVDTAKLQISRRTGRLASEGDRTSEHVLIDEGRLSGRDSKANDERDRVCTELPEFEAAMSTGECTAAHLDALARHTRDLSDAERSDLTTVVSDLVRDAANDPVGLFDRKAKHLVDRIREMHRPGTKETELERQRAASEIKRWTDRASGMHHTHISLDPIRDAALGSAIDAHLARLRQAPGNETTSFRALQVEALVAAVSSGDAGRRVPEIVVHVDAASLCHGEHDETVCETVGGVRLPVSSAQRLCCEAVIEAVVVEPDGTVDRICAEQRTANRRQRRMLSAMYRSCVHPHCEVSFDACRVHHVEWFSNGGQTVLANLVPLCEQHHHLVHEGRWNLSIDRHRRVTWFRPDGTVWLRDDGPERSRVVDRAATRSPASDRARDPSEAVRPTDEPANAPPCGDALDAEPALL